MRQYRRLSDELKNRIRAEYLGLQRSRSGRPKKWGIVKKMARDYGLNRSMLWNLAHGR